MKVAILLLFTLIVVSSTGCWRYITRTQSDRTANSIEEVILKDLPIVTPCLLQNSLDEFDGAFIRIEATVIQSLHGFKLDPDQCDGIGGAEPFVSTVIALDTSGSENSSVFLRLKEILGAKVGIHKARIVAIGRFRVVAPSEKSDAWIDRLPWQFEIYKIEREISLTSENPNNKPEGWKIPLNGNVLSRQTVELDGPQGKERVEFTRRDVPEHTKLVIPYFGGRTNYIVRVQNVEELAREGQFPYAYQMTVAEVCERPKDCRPVSWIIRVRDEDGDKIFETYGGTVLPPAWAK